MTDILTKQGDEIDRMYDGLDANVQMMTRPKLRKAVVAILVELARAERVHPTWPTGTMHQVAIMAGEAGEALQAVLHLDEGRGSMEAVRDEVVQSGAMALRCLMNLEGGK